MRPLAPVLVLLLAACGSNAKAPASAEAKPAKAATKDAPASPAAPAAAPTDAPPAAAPTEAAPAAAPTADAPTDAVAAAPAAADGGPVIDHTVKLLDGTDKSLADYRGKAVLVVNTASECGYTPQYADLQKLYATYKDRGLEVLAFPSNDFGAQEPGTPEEIRTFVDEKFDVEFEMFDKVHARGDEISPLYRTLSEQTGEGIAGEVKWNFTKFLVDPQGHVVARFEPPVSPTDPSVIAAVEKVLPPAAG